MRLLVFGMLAFALTVSGPAAAALSSNDQSFVQDAQHDTLGVYAIASLAKNKAQDSTAKDLAAKALANASVATNFIRKYAATHGVQTDNKPSLQADNQYGDLSSSKGKNFDQTFASAMKVDANFAIDTYQDEAQHGSDPALRNFAKQQLSAMQQLAAEAAKISG